ncbi:MAG: nucleotidyltransferase substrate binding protein [Candidatus Dadabacteria bacterium]|nr:nucleotidyltransferase substrate binding protein [Candidatus Dadabacteria bacterium]
MSIDTEFLRRCLDALEHSLKELERSNPDEIACDVYRAACVKEFEIILEQSGKLLRKVLSAYFADNRQADRLVFKDLFRHAVKRDLIDQETCERWLSYRDNRNDTAHSYGKDFAGSTIKLLPDFITDTKALADVIERTNDG